MHHCITCAFPAGADRMLTAAILADKQAHAGEDLMKSLAAALEWKENDVRTSVTRTRTFTGRLQHLDERWQRSFPITSRSYAYQGSRGYAELSALLLDVLGFEAF